MSVVKYRCSVCGYIHEGELPEGFTCPVCKQPATAFEKMTEKEIGRGNCFFAIRPNSTTT